MSSDEYSTQYHLELSCTTMLLLHLPLRLRVILSACRSEGTALGTGRLEMNKALTIA
jgi:hypothetical protein